LSHAVTNIRRPQVAPKRTAKPGQQAATAGMPGTKYTRRVHREIPA